MSKWMIMLQTGRTIGPFTTKGVVKMIQEGGLGGSERAKKLPEGEWVELASVPDFYDSILDSLQKGKVTNQKMTEMMTEDTVIRPRLPEDPEEQKQIVEFFESIGEAPPSELTTIKKDSAQAAPENQQKLNSATKLSDPQIAEDPSKFKKLLPLALIAGGGVILVLVILLWVPEKKIRYRFRAAKFWSSRPT